VRITVICVVLALYVIACGTTPKPVDISNRVAPPIDISIAIDASTRDHLAFGLPVDVSLHTLDAEVGRCTLSFDLWEEHYRIGFSKTDVQHAPDAEAAARMCIDREAVQRAARGKRTATVEVREVPYEKPLSSPSPYPEF
jgi:hypothetical protein